MPRVLPAEPRQLTVGGDEGGYNEHLGIYQVSCFFPKGANPSTAREEADFIASHFKRGGSVRTVGTGAYIITQSGNYLVTQTGDPLAITEAIRVRFLRSWVNGPIEEDRWFHLPVTVRWFADIVNT
ncbi:DUF4128 domain-containing protein [Patescibacteria group bacterium]|nr:DUF4128 domain-containing protein [Patescibacteria group bacterium]